MSIKKALGVVTLAALASFSAQAADWYVGASIGQSDFKEDVSGVASVVSIDKKDTGYKLFLGAGLTPNFAIEGGYANFGKLKASATIGATTYNFGVKGHGYFVDLVGKLPVSNEFGVFGKVGVFNGRAKTYGISALGVAGGDPSVVDESDSGTDVKYGLGLSYAINKSVGIRAEWERYRFKAFDGKTDVDLMSVGVTLGF